MTNSEWLKSLEPGELKEWFESEHVESASEHELAKLMAEYEDLRERLSSAIGHAREIAALADLGGEAR